MNTNEKRDRNIDFLKGIAIISIIMCHSSQVYGEDIQFLSSILKFGQLGCQVFLFMTGYLMTKQLLSVGFSFAGKDYIGYLWKRLKKVLLPWYFAIAIYFILTTLLNRFTFFIHPTNRNPIAVLINILFLNGVFPFANNSVVPGGWYIGLLVLIWAIFPLIYHLGRNKRSILIVLIVLFVSIGIIVGITFGPSVVKNNSFYYFSAFNQIPCFIMGMLFAQIHHVNLQTVSLLVIPLLIIDIIIFYLNPLFAFVYVPTLTSLIVGLLLILLQNSIKIRYSNIVTDTICKVGQDSLYYYLSHIIIVWYLHELFYGLLSHWITNSYILFLVFSIICLPLLVLIAKGYKGIVSKLNRRLGI